RRQRVATWGDRRYSDVAIHTGVLVGFTGHGENGREHRQDRDGLTYGHCGSSFGSMTHRDVPARSPSQTSGRSAIRPRPTRAYRPQTPWPAKQRLFSRPPGYTTAHGKQHGYVSSDRFAGGQRRPIPQDRHLEKSLRRRRVLHGIESLQPPALLPAPRRTALSSPPGCSHPLIRTSASTIAC